MAGKCEGTHFSGLPSAESEAVALCLLVSFENVYREFFRRLMLVARSRGASPEEAEDLTQEFFFRTALHGYLSSFDKSKSSLEEFITMLYQRFLSKQWHRQTAVKRGGACRTLNNVEITTGGQQHGIRELADWRTPLVEIEERWAAGLLSHAILALRKELAEQGKAAVFDTLLPRLLGEHKGRSRSGNADRMRLSRYRRRLRFLICRELGVAGLHPKAVLEEVRQLGLAAR